MQHEDLPRAGRQLFDRRLEIHSQVATGRRDCDDVESRRVVRHPFALDRIGAPPLDDHVDRQPVEPGRERRLASELPQLLPRADEDVLRDLVSLVAADHAPGQTVNPRHMRPVEPLEGVRIPAGRQGHIGLGRCLNGGLAGQRHHGSCQNITDNYLDGLGLPKVDSLISGPTAASGSARRAV